MNIVSHFYVSGDLTPDRSVDWFHFFFIVSVADFSVQFGLGLIPALIIVLRYHFSEVYSFIRRVITLGTRKLVGCLDAF